jgi:hypothetical protein
MRVHGAELETVKRQVMSRNRPATSGELEGVIIDASYFLEQSGILDVRKIKKTGDTASMLQVVCRPISQVVAGEKLVSEVERVWLEEICFQDFEAHALEVSKENAHLDFVTVSQGSNHYYTGRITVNLGK